MLWVAHVQTLCFLQPGSLCGCLIACITAAVQLYQIAHALAGKRGLIVWLC